MNIFDRRRLLVDRDKMNHAPKAEVATTCVSIFDRIQDRPKHLQLLALASAFILLSGACNIPAQDVFAAATNVMKDPLTSTGLGLQFQAMRYHLDTELLEGRNH